MKKLLNSSKTPQTWVETRNLSPFAKRVYAVVAKIPKGKVMTYKQVAAKAGSPDASRAVGMLMKQNYNPNVPCHRVIRSDGKIGDYNRGGRDRKIEILREEGFKGLVK